MTNILITGITGFIGSHLANQLAQNTNDTIYGLHRSVKHETTFNALNLHNKNNICLVLGDINHIGTIQEILNDYNIDQVYHLASQTIVKNAANAPLPTYVTNIFGTLVILEAIRQTNKEIPTLVQSSDKAYGKSPILPYTENLPLNGSDIYSSSKACQDILSRAYAINYNLPIVTTRPCNVYGEFDFNWSRIIPQFIKAYLTKSKITIYKSTSNQIREYIHINDLTSALQELIQNIEKTKGQSFNITSGYRYNVNDIINIFKQSTGYENIEYIDSQKGFKEIENQTLDSSKIENTTNWHAKIKLDTNILTHITEQYRTWFKNN